MSDNDQTQISKLVEIKGRGGNYNSLVMIYGENIGQKYDIAKERLAIGRGPDNDIILVDSEVSREHAVIEMHDGSVLIADNDSTNGTLVNDKDVLETVLANGDLIRIGSTIFKYLHGGDVESLYHEAVYQLTITDGLTQIANKRFLLDFLDKEFSRALRYNRPLSLVMFDIDLFKNVNDTWGHLTGDFVLTEIAYLLRKRVRREELFARYGGEEFMLVLPETELQGALHVAEQVREMVAQHKFIMDEERISITISLGVACMNPEMKKLDSLVAAVDERMYQAKREGRDRVCG